jgi:hypothetical protein
MSDDDLIWAVEASATQIALGWVVHQWKPAVQGSGKPLDLQIVHFSAQAISEMCASYPILCNATEELRWLIYFKGLIAANTHPYDQMLNAIDAVRGRRPDPLAELSGNSMVRLNDVSGPDRTSQADALEAIDRALSEASYGECSQFVT